MRRLAAGGVVFGGTAWSSAMCYAVQLAYDDADDPVYDNGWQEGDDGGTGILGPWNFDPTYNTADPGQQAIDDGAKAGVTGSSPYNDIGRAWTLFNPNAPNVTTPTTETGPDNPPSDDTDISHAGRAILGDLPVGATLKVVIDNPAERRFFRGYTMRLNTGDGNAQSGLAPKPRFSVGTFDYLNDGQWYMTNVEEPGVPLYVRDDTTGSGEVGTDSGLRIEFTLTGVDTYTASMIPLDNPGAAFMTSGMLETDSDGDPNNGNDNLLAGLPLDWIEFEFYNTDSDFYPTMVTGAPPPLPGDYNGNGAVDAADYVLWRNGGPLQNEVDVPGTINEADYTEWRARFGNVASAARATDFYIRSMEITTPDVGSGLNGAVPEPSTFVILIAGAAGLVLHCVRRRVKGGSE